MVTVETHPAGPPHPPSECPWGGGHPADRCLFRREECSTGDSVFLHERKGRQMPPNSLGFLCSLRIGLLVFEVSEGCGLRPSGGRRPSYLESTQGSCGSGVRPQWSSRSGCSTEALWSRHHV